MEFDAILTFLKSLAPWVSYVLIGLGSAVVLGTGIDKMIPDEKDGGFMTKAYNIPVLGGLLKSLARLSPFNIKE
jgi:hypothetical protein